MKVFYNNSDLKNDISCTIKINSTYSMVVNLTESTPNW